ncbi:MULTISPECIES: homocysteine S-methyltransferase family protein [unclassified Nostoc]|uniref:homocysteine S-methyltransferase family protein n=1 Tax=Nostoc sp. GT001 TaxID=3056647 RepID=UPI0025AAFE2B|nr:MULTISPECIES: homocysteine S-methyltransferase family protein [unclassified Nostoc]MDM9583979.1 hypothetical protein [Nostoc sp. GT001]MDZ7945021.1 hypothetical protein [Nostoc sp. EfeVER01]MDZ7991618.1 hypothetical protein [Nostoc sp. EspVER01]
MLVGSKISAVLTILEHYLIDILRLNCATSRDLMKPHIKYLAEHSPFIVSYIPNAGLPENLGSQADYCHSRVTKGVLRFCANTPYDYDRFIIAMSTTGVVATSPTLQAIASSEIRCTKHSSLSIEKL